MKLSTKHLFKKLSMSFASFSIAILSVTMFTFAIVAVTILPFHATITIFLAIATAMTMSFTMNVAFFTFTVMTLTIWPLDNTGGANTVTGVTMAITVSQQTGDQAQEHCAEAHNNYYNMENISGQHTWKPITLVPLYTSLYIEVAFDKIYKRTIQFLLEKQILINDIENILK